MTIWLFDPITALAGVAAGSQVIGGIQESKQEAQNARDQISDINARVKNERVSAARELRDLDTDTTQQIALMKARAVAGGGSAKDVGFQALARRTLKEVSISRGRIAEDRDVNITNLLTFGGNVARAAKDKQKTALFRGAAGGASSLINIFG